MITVVEDNIAAPQLASPVAAPVKIVPQKKSFYTFPQIIEIGKRQNTKTRKHKNVQYKNQLD